MFTTTAPTGVGLYIEQETKEVTEKLFKILKGEVKPTDENLEEVSSPTLKITRKLIAELQDNANGETLAQKLASEVAFARTVEKVLILRRSLIAGMKEPNISADETAMTENEKNLHLLDKEIYQLKLELEFQQMLGNHTALTTLSNTGAQRMSNATPTVTDNSLEVLEKMDKEIKADSDN